MDLNGHVMDLESLINRYTILVFIKVLCVILALILVWIVPYIGKPIINKHKKRKTKRKIKIEKEAKNFKEKWASALEKGDPYYNPNLSLKHSYVYNFSRKQ